MPFSTLSFGEFQLDYERFELLREGTPVKLERIPMELLILLAGSDGKVVSRQEIADRLWGKDVHVDTEHSINTAIRKVRQALKDDPENPRYVLTVTGKGYRFVAERNGKKPEAPTASFAPPVSQPPKQGSKFILAAAGSVLFVIALVFGYRSLRSKPAPSRRIQSIAVLPLANLSGDASKEYFADGMTDELITALAKNRALRVVSRTTIMQYKGAKRPVRDIAHDLGVDGIIEGSIEQSGNRVHMTVQLIHAASDTHIWAESYDRDAKGSFSLATDLSQDIAREVKLAVTPQSPRYVSPEAHDAYLRGRYFWFNDNYDRAEEYFEKSKELQPDYAAAWTGIADILTVRAVAGIEPSKNVREKAQAAARKAVELDDSLSEAHNALAATYLFLDWDWKRADEESRRAIELNPNLAEPHHLRSYVMAALNRMDEAFLEQKRSSELDPFQRPWALGYTYLQMRRYDDAIRELEMRKEGLPNDVYTRFMLADAYAHKQMWKESAGEYEQGIRAAGGKSGADEVHQEVERNGPKVVFDLRLRHALARAKEGYVVPIELAQFYAWVGNKEETLRLLEAAYNERSSWLVFIQEDGVYDFLHSEPRYRAIVKNMGLPPAY